MGWNTSLITTLPTCTTRIWQSHSHWNHCLNTGYFLSLQGLCHAKMWSTDKILPHWPRAEWERRCRFFPLHRQGSWKSLLEFQSVMFCLMGQLITMLKWLHSPVRRIYAWLFSSWFLYKVVKHGSKKVFLWLDCSCVLQNSCWNFNPMWHY